MDFNAKYLLALSVYFICICGLQLASSSPFQRKGFKYPDMRKDPRKDCGRHVPDLSYVCDPDELLLKESAHTLSDRLHQLALRAGKKCPCQRDSQCESKYGADDMVVRFAVAIAFVRNLEYISNKTTPIGLAEQFCKYIRHRWALGDCGNSVYILIWEKQKMLYILTDRNTEKYVTKEEVKAIQSKVQSKIEQGLYPEALLVVIEDIEKELNGTAEVPIDIGAWSFIGCCIVASIFVVIVTGCVFAFRFCGNEDTLVKKTTRENSLKAQMIRRGGSLRRSLSRSPKLPHLSPTSSLRRLNLGSPMLHKGRSMDSPTATRHLLPTITVAPPMSNMARLANPYYYGEDDGHSMV